MVLIGAFVAGHRSVVPQRRATVVDPGLKHVDDGGVKPIGFGPSQRPLRGVDLSSPQGFVGVDISNPGHRALTQQLRLDSPGAFLHRRVQPRGREVTAKRFRSDLGQRLDALIVAGPNNPEPTETPNIAEDQRAVVIELPPGSHVWILLVRGGRFGQPMQRAGHAQVHNKFPVIVQADQEILAPPTHLDEARASHLQRRSELGRPVAPCFGDRPTNDLGPQAAANGFDLGQLGHGATLPRGCHPWSVSTSDEPTSDLADASLRDVFAELAAAADQLGPLNLSQRDAWISGLLATWRTDVAVADPVTTDADFAAWCREQSVDPTLTELAERAANQQLSAGVTATGAWCVSAQSLGLRSPRGEAPTESIIIGFVHADESEHTVLAEVSVPAASSSSSQRELRDLQVGPPPDEVLPDRAPAATAESFAPGSAPVTDDDDGDLLMPDVEEWPIDAAARTVIVAWQATWNSVAGAWPADRGDALLVNQAVVASRLTQMADEPLTSLAEFGPEPEEPVERYMGMSETEIEDANRRSLETLHRSLASLRNVPAPDSASVAATELIHPLAAPMMAGPAQLSRDEREALAFLEWADWLGAVLGIMRSEAGVPLTGSAMVDHINRCPEVTSSIEKRDREFVAWAFDVAIAWWSDIGAVDEAGVLSEPARWAMPRALAHAWNGDF